MQSAKEGPSKRAKATYKEEWDSSIKNGDLSFPCLAEAYFGRRDSSDPERQRVCIEYYPKLLKVFEDSHGPAIFIHWCSKTNAAVAYTEGRGKNILLVKYTLSNLWNVWILKKLLLRARPCAPMPTGSSGGTLTATSVPKGSTQLSLVR